MRRTRATICVLPLLVACAMAGCGDATKHNDDASDLGFEPDATDATDATISVACNDGVLSPLEQCEGFDLRGALCTDLGYSGGTLRCADDCTFDERACTSCGDGVADGLEACDGADVRGAVCADYFGPDATGEVGCAADCSRLLSDSCSRAAPVSELDACDADDPSPCDADLDCVETAVGAFCLEGCDADDDCDAADFCYDQGAGESACVARPVRGERCTAESGCGDGSECFAAFAGASICAEPCFPTGGSTCGDDERCVVPPAAPVEAGASDDCGAAGGTCDDGFECVPDGDGGTCLRPLGLCATPAAFYEFEGDGPPDAALCDRGAPSAGGRFCGGLDGDAFPSCVPVFGDDVPFGACVAICDDGTLEGDEDRSCGSGRTCAVPTAPELFHAQGEPATAGCDLEEPACPSDFPACIDFGSGPVCARPARICVGER